MASKIVSVTLVLWLTMVAGEAQADVRQATHTIHDDTVDAAHKTGLAARHAGHATANAARRATHATGHAIKAVGHDIAGAARNGYHATRRAVHGGSRGVS